MMLEMIKIISKCQSQSISFWHEDLKIKYTVEPKLSYVHEDQFQQIIKTWLKKKIKHTPEF